MSTEDPGEGFTFNWYRAWWGIAAGVLVALLGLMFDGRLGWWLAVPFLGFIAGSPFNKGPQL